MLYTVDGNDSLKRIIHHEQVPELSQKDAKTLGASTEAFDTWVAGCGMYLTHTDVGKWSMEALSRTVPMYNDEDPEDDNPCVEWWCNMKSEITARMWGVFEETGLFLSLCRHGFVLLLTDMIHSSKQYIVILTDPTYEKSNVV